MIKDQTCAERKSSWPPSLSNSPPLVSQVMAAAAETLTPVVLELGGKDAFIVCEDANLAVVSQWSMVFCWLRL